jgi:hypothetical protein
MFVENWRDYLSVAETLMLAIITWAALRDLAISRANHSLYKDFFASRTAWYAARSKPKGKSPQPDVEPPDKLVLSGLSREIDRERRDIQLLGDDSSPQDPSVRDAVAPEESPKR